MPSTKLPFPHFHPSANTLFAQLGLNHPRNARKLHTWPDFRGWGSRANTKSKGGVIVNFIPLGGGEVFYFPRDTKLSPRPFPFPPPFFFFFLVINLFLPLPLVRLLYTTFSAACPASLSAFLSCPFRCPPRFFCLCSLWPPLKA